MQENLDHENGLRGERGCSDGMFTVKQLLRKRREHGLEAWVLCLDLVEAFDRVPRDLLSKAMLNQGVPPMLVSLLKALHAQVNVKFNVDGVEKTPSSIIGIKQGDLLGLGILILHGSSRAYVALRTRL